MWVGGLYDVCCNTEEEAREAALEDMSQDFDLFSEYFGYDVSYDQLLLFAMKHEDFYETFCNEIDNAEETYFRENYFEEEEEDDD